MPVVIIGQRGATSWGFQIGRAFLYVSYPRYWRHGYFLQIGWERD